MTSTARSADSDVEIRRTGRALFLLMLGVYVMTAGGSLTSTDAVSAFDLTQSLIERHSVALSGNLTGSDALVGADGRYYSPFGIVQSIWDAPFYLAGRAVSAAGVKVGKPDSVPKAMVALSQTLLCAVIVWMTFHLAVLIGGSRAAALWAAITLGIGSLLWPYARFGFNQPLACATLLAAVANLVAGVRGSSSRKVAVAGWWLGAACLTRHELMLAIPVLAIWLWADGAPESAQRRRRFTAFAPGIAVSLTFWLIYNWIRFGNPVDSGYLRDPVPGLGASLFTGLAGFLLSPGGSVVLYSPFVVLGVWGLIRETRGSQRSIAWLCLAIIATFLLFYAQLGNWTGWRAYGPRYLVIVLPYAALGFALWLRTLDGRALRAAGLAACLTGFVIQWPGVLMDYAKVSQSAAAGVDAPTRSARQWEWRESMLVLNARAAWHAVPANIRYVAGLETPPHPPAPADAGDRSFSQQFAFSLDWWWLYLFYMGAISRFVVAIVAAASVVWIAYWTRHVLPPRPPNPYRATTGP